MEWKTWKNYIRNMKFLLIIYNIFKQFKRNNLVNIKLINSRFHDIKALNIFYVFFLFFSLIFFRLCVVLFLELFFSFYIYIHIFLWYWSQVATHFSKCACASCFFLALLCNLVMYFLFITSVSSVKKKKMDINIHVKCIVPKSLSGIIPCIKIYLYMIWNIIFVEYNINVSLGF